jgi:hypothetical protein
MKTQPDGYRADAFTSNPEQAAEKRAEATSEAQTTVGTSKKPHKRWYADPAILRFSAAC